MAFSVDVTLAAEAQLYIAPAGIDTPQASCLGCTVEGGAVRAMIEPGTGQKILAITPRAAELRFHYTYDARAGAYPEAMFRPMPSRFTRAAEALLAEARAIAPDAPPRARARAIACATAERFTYGHPETRFNDGCDEIPALGCGMAEGSCVDINTYFIAALRAAGIEAGYAVGYFFPAEKGDHCEDAHCWVVTRIDGETAEWDIAHHLKLGTRDIHPGLNPKPGFRAAVGHSMGLAVPELGIADLKLLSEPVPVAEARAHQSAATAIRLRHPAIPRTAA